MTNPDLAERRERVFIVLAGFFLCSMTLLNVIGLTRFIQLGPMSLAIGVLPYPLTFLCTDLISELYGRSRANFVVGVGFVLNFFILACMWLGNLVPPVPEATQPPWQVIQLAESIALPNGDSVSGSVELFQLIYACTSGAVFASMMAYIAAQFCDVQVFHFLKRLTKDKHLWIRNNFSTLTSQMVDSVVVISVTFGALFLADKMSLATMLTLIASSYLFKMIVALLDTGPFYFCSEALSRYLQFPVLVAERTRTVTLVVIAAYLVLLVAALMLVLGDTTNLNGTWYVLSWVLLFGFMFSIFGLWEMRSWALPALVLLTVAQIVMWFVAYSQGIGHWLGPEGIVLGAATVVAFQQRANLVSEEAGAPA